MSLEKKKIMICEFHQESNTFNTVPADMSWFGGDSNREGMDCCQGYLKSGKNVVSGMYTAVEEAGGELIPAIFLRSGSGGRVADEVLERMLDRMRYYIETTEEFDALCVSLHGATCTVSQEDACGVFLQELRRMVGDKPIAAAFDLHANITGKILEAADIVCGYQTYPHTDHYETGYRAGRLLMQMLAGEAMEMASASVPVLVPPSGYSSMEGAFRELEEAGKALVEEGKLLDYSVFPVQPWLDIKEISSVAVAIGKDLDEAREYAQALIGRLYERRKEYMPNLQSVDEIIDLAEQNQTGKPVILVDASDSPNGGAVGDSPVVAMRLLERGSTLRAGMFVKDPAAAAKAFEVGVGNSSEFTLGAAFTTGIPGPMKAVGRVRSLHDGRFMIEGPANRGSWSSFGKCAVVSFGNVDILISTGAGHSGDPQGFRHFGIEPTLYDLIVVKANTSFKKPYSAFAGPICYADTPGACAANLKLFHWERVPSGLYPLDMD